MPKHLLLFIFVSFLSVSQSFAQGSSPLQVIGIDFDNNKGNTPVGWNNITDKGAGSKIEGLWNRQSQPTGYSMEITAAFNGSNMSGLSTGNDSGPVPDAVMVAFQYRYDGRRRMIEKKVPGADWIYMVYDQRDRLVLTQDGRQREVGEWSFTKYDALNRPVSTGIYPHSDTAQADMQAILDTFYNNATNDGYHEERGSAVHGYTNRSFPQVSDEDAYLTVTYYDNYGFKDMIGHAGYDYKNDELPNQETTENARVKGLVTGTKTRVLGTNQFLWSVTYYDKKYRPVQTAMGNYPDGLDRVTNIYNFPGWLMETRLSHQGEETATVHMSFNYDHTGRLLETYHKINNGDPVQLSRNEYNELGELVTKNLYKEGSTYAQSVDYRYNIRGWLKRINNSDLSPDPDDDRGDLFGMELFYEDGFEKPQYNGNISGARWKNGVDNMERAYGYTYDAMNRLTGADYVAGGTGNWTKEENRFEVGNISYDHNGNILSLHRNGLFRYLPGEVPEYGITDQLTYYYKGNQLMAVNDAMDTPQETKNDFKDNGSKGDPDNPEYAYDANGNMVRDDNKGITVTYNHLNLPRKVDFGNNKYIEYTYDAAGTKLRQEVHDGQNPVKRTDYVGGMVYEDGQLQFIQHGEGRVVMVDSDGLSKLPEYQYHLKDHLGNVRLTFSASPETKSNTATLETIHEDDESATFLRYAETTKINSTLFDHTNNGDTHYAVRLNGSERERIGLARSLAVMTGDTVRAEVYAKYLDPDPSNWTAALQNLMAAIAAGTAPTGTVIEAVPPVGGDNFPFEGLLDAAKANDTGTRAYLNILLFDENLTFVDGAFVPVTTAAKENGTNVPHEKLSQEIVVQQPGYAYIYFSNDNGQPLEVFFDDFTVEHVHSAIVQADDYYPFGMTFNEYRRENSVANNYLYNDGTERITELELGVDFTAFRAYDPAVGRWWQPDPLYKYHESPYAWVTNNPIRFNDPLGLDTLPEVVVSARRLPQNSNQALIPSGPLLKPSPKPIPPEVVVTGISASTIGGGILTAVLVAMPTSMGTDDAWTKEDSDNLNELEGKELTRTLTPGEKRRLEALRDKWFKFNPVMKTQWGWTSTPVWKDLAKIIRTGGTITELAGKVPSKVEAIRLIRETGGRIERIEGPHAFPNPHNYNHINYTTSSGNKGTIKIQEL